MYEKIFGKYPQVKAINYILINPQREYTKKEIAYGSKISRVTLDSFINNLTDQKILIKEGQKYKVNLKSEIVKTLIKTQIKLADITMKEELKHPENIKGEPLTDEEFENFIASFDYEVDIDKELEKIENNGEIVYPNINEELNSINNLMFTKNNQNPVSINGFYDKNKERRMINYG